MFSLPSHLKRPITVAALRRMHALRLSSLSGKPCEFDIGSILASSKLARCGSGHILRIEGQQYRFPDIQTGDYIKLFSGTRKRNARVHSVDEEGITLQFL